MLNQENPLIDLSALDKTYSRQMFAPEVLQRANIPSADKAKISRNVYIGLVVGLPILLFVSCLAVSGDVGLSLIVTLFVTILVILSVLFTRSGQFGLQRDIVNVDKSILNYLALAQTNGWEYTYLPDNQYEYDSVRVQKEGAFYSSDRIPRHGFESDSPEIKALALEQAEGGRITSQLRMNDMTELVEYVISGDPAKRGMNLTRRLDINKAFLRVRFSKEAPHLLLDSKRNEERFVSEDYVKQSLNLEGDFPDTFELYAPIDYQIDALQIFTPDVMQAFLDCGQEFDYELIGDSLYIFVPTDTIRSSDRLKQLLDGAHKLRSEVAKQLATYSDDRVSSQLGTSAQPAMVAPQGANMAENLTTIHLKRKFSFWVWRLMMVVVSLLFFAAVAAYYALTRGL